MSRPRIMSLCSGYAGLDRAAEEVTGGVTVAFAEYDDDPSKILAHHWPDVPNLRDVKNIDWQAWVGKVDIMTAGYPCQPFSHAGKRAGENDPRHLWPAIIAGIRVLRPRLVLLENVRGHLSLGFDAVLGDLAEAGFDAEWCLLRASDVGAPHGRARLFIAATDALSGGWDGWSRDPQREPVERVATAGRGRVTASDPRGERHGEGVHAGGVGRVDGEDAGEARQRERARQVAGDRGGATPTDTEHLVGHGAGRAWDRRAEPADGGGATTDTAGTGLEGRRPKRGGITPALPADSGPTADTGREYGRPRAAFNGSPASGGSATQPQRPAPTTADTEGERLEGVGLGVTSGGQACGGRVRDTAGDVGGVEWGAYGPAIHRWEAVLARPAPRPTEPGRNGRERLSPRFVEWMMGLSEGHVTDVPGLSRNAQLKALGNGVVPQQAAAAYRMLLATTEAQAA